MIAIAVTSHSAFGAAATLAISGHPAVCGIVLSRDLGDAAGHHPAMRGVPCLLLDFVSAAAADAALARLRSISARFTDRETPTRIACSGGVSYTLRQVYGFDEPTIAAIDAHHADAAERYAAAQRAAPRPGRGRARR